MKFSCSNEQLTTLPYVNNNVTILECGDNKIKNLDNLHENLQQLYCGNNKITNLDNLPNTLVILECGDNPIARLDKLPITLKQLINCKNCFRRNGLHLVGRSHRSRLRFRQHADHPGRPVGSWKCASIAASVVADGSTGPRTGDARSLPLSPRVALGRARPRAHGGRAW